MLLEEIITRYNITDNDMVSLNKEMHKKNIEKLIKEGIHTAKITPPKNGGMWCTYVHDDSKATKRKQIQARTEEGFYRSLYLWYFPSGDEYKKATIESLLEETIDYKQNVLLNDIETIKKFRSVYKKYYSNTEFIKIPIAKIKSSDCEDFFNSFIEKGIKEKAFNGLIGIANSVFDYAISTNIIIT